MNGILGLQRLSMYTPKYYASPIPAAFPTFNGQNMILRLIYQAWILSVFVSPRCR